MSEASAQMGVKRAASVVQLRDRTWRITLSVPVGFIGTSQCYVLEDDDDGLHVVDPGWDLEPNRQVLAEGLASFGKVTGDVRSVIGSHLHPDHIGLGNWLRSESGARLVIGRAEQRAIDTFAATPESERLARHRSSLARWGVPPSAWKELAEAPVMESLADVHADTLVDTGDRLDIPGRDVLVVGTPGHTPGSICLKEAADNAFFTGDHVLPTVSPAPGTGGSTESNALVDLLSSLSDVTRFDGAEAFPGHGEPFFGLAARCAEIAQHHIFRSEEVAAVLERDRDATVWGLSQAVTWRAGWNGLADHHKVSALRQIEMHAAFVSASSDWERVGPSRWK